MMAPLTEKQLTTIREVVGSTILDNDREALEAAYENLMRAVEQLRTFVATDD